jgi:hypothetical protein
MIYYLYTRLVFCFEMASALHGKLHTYRVIQEELPPLKELMSEDILSKKCHKLGLLFLNFNFNFNYKITSS